MKGSAITGPVGKEAAELWPVCNSPAPFMARNHGLTPAAYCVQLGRGDVRGFVEEGFRACTLRRTGPSSSEAAKECIHARTRKRSLWLVVQFPLFLRPASPVITMPASAPRHRLLSSHQPDRQRTRPHTRRREGITQRCRPNERGTTKMCCGRSLALDVDFPCCRCLSVEQKTRVGVFACP